MVFSEFLYFFIDFTYSLCYDLPIGGACMSSNDDSIKRNISKNILKFRELSGLSQKEFAQKLGVTPSRVSNWEQGANCPTIDILFDVCNVLGVSINDIYGVYPDANFSLSYDEQTTIKKYRALDDHGKEIVNLILDKESKRVETYGLLSDSPVRLRMYTYLQKIACAGTGFCFDDIPYETIEAPLVDGADFIIGVNGDSMEPEYHDGDKLYVKRVEHLQIDEVGIFTIGNECFLKKLGEDGLISLNPEYKNILGNEDIRLVGKVIGKFSE